jgi:hypothetical protein
MTETETETGASRPSSQEERASWVKKKKNQSRVKQSDE